MGLFYSLYAAYLFYVFLLFSNFTMKLDKFMFLIKLNNYKCDPWITLLYGACANILNYIVALLCNALAANSHY